MNQVMTHIGLAFLFFLSSMPGNLAQSPAEMPGAKPVNPYAFDDIGGSPYLLDTFSLATIYGSNLTVYENILMNYNGKTQLLEVKLGNQTYELDPMKYLRAEIVTGRVDANGRPEKMILQRGVHKRFENGFVRVVYRGRRMILADQFKAKAEDTPTIQMEKRKEFTRFWRNHEYYLKHHTEIHPVVLDEKSIGKILGHRDEMAAFIREKGLDITRESDLSILLKWYEDKGFVR